MNKTAEQPVLATESAQALMRAREALESEPINPWPAGRYRHLAGALFIASALGAVPNYFLEEPRPDPAYWAIIAAAFCMGVICMVVRWDRISPRWVHLAIAAAAIEIAGLSAVADLELEFLYIFVIVFAALIFPSTRTVAAWVAICGVLLFGPIVWTNEHDNVDDAVRHVLLILPGLIVIAVAVGYLRDGLMVQRERVHRLAEETIDVAQRMGRD